MSIHPSNFSHEFYEQQARAMDAERLDAEYERFGPGDWKCWDCGRPVDAETIRCEACEQVRAAHREVMDTYERLQRLIATKAGPENFAKPSWTAEKLATQATELARALKRREAA